MATKPTTRLRETPLQTAPEYFEGSPEGQLNAPAGYFVIDFTTGDWYRKSTSQEFNTGWLVVSSGGSGGGNMIGVGDPPAGVYADGTIYTDRVGARQWYYDKLAADWIQTIA